ncbi:MAG TPA: CHAT domain-containing protein [Crinalium sp.]
MNIDPCSDLEAAIEEAERLRQQGNLYGAYMAYAEILKALLMRCPQHLSMGAGLLVVHSIADLSLLFGDFEASDYFLMGAIGLCERAGNRVRADFARLKQIQMAIDRGRLLYAEDLLQQMAAPVGRGSAIPTTPDELDQWEQRYGEQVRDQRDRTVLLAHIYLTKGRLLAALGQYGHALLLLQRGLIHAEPQELDESWPDLARQTAMPLKLAIANAYFEKGDLADSKDWTEKIWEQMNPQRERWFYIRWLELSGKQHLLCGELGLALKRFQEILDLCGCLGSQQAVLRATLNLVNVLILLNQNSLAKDYLVGAQEDAAATNDPVLQQRVQLLMRLTEARQIWLDPASVTDYRQMPRSPQSNRPPDTSISPPQRIQSANYLALFNDRVLEFHYQLSQFGVLAATDVLSQLQATFQSADSQLIQTKLKILQGILAYYDGVEHQTQNPAFSREKLRWAASLFSEVRPILGEQGLKPELWQVLRFLGWCWQRSQFPSADIDALGDEANQLLQTMTDSLSPEDQAVYLLNKWTASEEYIAGEITQLQHLHNSLAKSRWPVRWWRRWRLIRQLYALMEYIDRYKDALAKRTISGKDISFRYGYSRFWETFLLHPQYRVTLSFLVLPDRVFVVRNWRFHLDFFVVLTTRLDVRNTVKQWHETATSFNRQRRQLMAAERSRSLTLNRRMTRDFMDSQTVDGDEPTLTQLTDDAKAIASYLAKHLTIPELLDGLPSKTNAITIVPDDILHGFPFGAIAHEGRYLVERFALSINYESTSSNLFVQSLSHQSDRALVVGISDGIETIPPLPAVKRELEQIEGWLNDRKIQWSKLVNQDAQKLAVLHALSDAAFLHIACHGKFEHNRPDYSGLVLMSDEQKIDILSLRELSDLNLSGLHHITLSSCWSADHFILPGRWVISLPETLWRSGAQSILGCLWEVYDEFAVAFMQEFYQQLTQHQRDKALQLTQIKCINGKLSGSGTTHPGNPIYWAGFSLYGDYHRLDLLRNRRSHLSSFKLF